MTRTDCPYDGPGPHCWCDGCLERWPVRGAIVEAHLDPEPTDVQPEPEHHQQAATAAPTGGEA